MGNAVTPQGASVLNPGYIDIGNCVLFIAPVKFNSLAEAQSSNLWRRAGMLDGTLNYQRQVETYKGTDGIPAKTRIRIPTSSESTITGGFMEISPFNVSRVLGLAPITHTVKSSNPAPTTIGAGTTVNSLVLASATGYQPGDLLQVGTGLSAQYGMIRSLNGNTAALMEALDGNTIPANGTAVAKVDMSTVAIGSNAPIRPVALRIDKTISGGYGTLSMVFLHCLADGSISTSFQTGGASPNVLPFNFEVISDDFVENGAEAFEYFVQS